MLDRMIIFFVGLCLVACIVGVDTWIGYEFGRSLGYTERSTWIYGLLGFAVVALKSVIGVFTIRYARMRKWYEFLASLIVLIPCVIYSVAGGLGFSASNLERATSERSSVVNSRASAEREIARLETQLGELGLPRLVGELEPIIERMQARNAREDRDNLPSVRGELARAKERLSIEEALSGKRDALSRMPVVMTSTPPQVSAIAYLTGEDAKWVGIALAILLVALLETVSVFGPTMVFGMIDSRNAMPGGTSFMAQEPDYSPDPIPVVPENQHEPADNVIAMPQKPLAHPALKGVDPDALRRARAALEANTARDAQGWEGTGNLAARVEELAGVKLEPVVIGLLMSQLGYSASKRGQVRGFAGVTFVGPQAKKVA